MPAVTGVTLAEKAPASATANRTSFRVSGRADVPRRLSQTCPSRAPPSFAIRPRLRGRFGRSTRSPGDPGPGPTAGPAVWPPQRRPRGRALDVDPGLHSATMSSQITRHPTGARTDLTFRTFLALAPARPPPRHSAAGRGGGTAHHRPGRPRVDPHILQKLVLDRGEPVVAITAATARRPPPASPPRCSGARG